MRELVNLLKSLTEKLGKEEAVISAVNKSDPLWDLAKTEYSHDPVYAYRCLKRGVTPHV